MNILGVHEFTHDIGAAVVSDENLFAVEEERFSREKHHFGFDRAGGFPHQSVKSCLQEIKQGEVDGVYLAWKTGLLKWYLTKARILRCYRKAGLVHTRTKNSYFNLAHQVYSNWKRREKVLSSLRYACEEVPHHRAHASYAYRTSSLQKALVVVLDGSGESESGSIFFADKNDLHLIKRYPISQSIGTLYAIITRMIGLGRDAEGKTMGLASLGQPSQRTRYLSFDLRRDRFVIDYKEVKRSGERLRKSDRNREQIRRNIAATLQRDLNETLSAFFGYITVKYGQRDICFGGGVALNCVFNGMLATSSIVDHLYIPAAPNDSGVALGAALEGYSRIKSCYALGLNSSFLGTLPMSTPEAESNYGNIANDLYMGKVVAVCRGRSELGPRALGNRSIFVSARDPEIRKHLNSNIKNREEWRPYGIVILKEDLEKLFGVNIDAPYMNIAIKALPSAKHIIPGCIHVDGTVRIQTVTENSNTHVHKILQQYKILSGVGALINTSFNGTGEPIVNSSFDALNTFNGTRIDVLYLNGDRIPKPTKLRSTTGTYNVVA